VRIDQPHAAAFSGGRFIRSVAGVRDALSLPGRTRDVDGPEPDDFPDVAERIIEDGFMENAPPGVDPEADDLEAVLREAW